jgi:hypothetical protein
MWHREGTYDAIAERLFNALPHDRFLLEYDSPRAGSFAPLRFVPKGKVVVLGLVSTKVPELETVDALKRRIDEAAKILPLDQLAISPQCGFASDVAGNLLGADERRKLERVVETARLTPLDRVAGLRGRRFAGRVDLFPDGLHAIGIECRRWSGSGAILHANSKLARIGHEAQEPRGVSAQDRAISPGRCRPSFLHLLLAVDAVRNPDVITAERLPRCGGAKRYLGALGATANGQQRRCIAGGLAGELGRGDQRAIVKRRHGCADNPILAGPHRRRCGQGCFALQRAPERVNACLTRRAFESEAVPDPRDGIVRGLGLALLVEACQGQPSDQPGLHRRIPTVAVLAFSHS